MTTNETQELLLALKLFQRDIAGGIQIAVFIRGSDDDWQCEVLRPDDTGKFETPTGEGWIQIFAKKQKQEVLAMSIGRFLHDLDRDASHWKSNDPRALLPSWRLKGTGQRPIAITYASPFLQGGAPGLVQQK
jgi:hypothetical protein